MTRSQGKRQLVPKLAAGATLGVTLNAASALYGQGHKQDTRTGANPRRVAHTVGLPSGNGMPYRTAMTTAVHSVTRWQL